MAPIVNDQDLLSLLRIDNIFEDIISKYGVPPNWSRPQGFVSLSKIILEQQVSLDSANAHFQKLFQYMPSFTPHEILKLSDKEMLNCQISRQKSTYLRALSTAIEMGTLDLDDLESLDDAEIRHQLTAIKGIGTWTADIYMMFCLQSKDILPMGDIAIINTIKELTIAKTKEEIEIHIQKWRPYRSLASYILWHYYLKKRKRDVPQDDPNTYIKD